MMELKDPNLTRQLNFLRPVINGYETHIERLVKNPSIKHISKCFLPVKCAYTGKSLFLKPAVKVKITDHIWDPDTETRYYSSNSFTYLSLML